jgi:hypothetical protein
MAATESILVDFSSLEFQETGDRYKWVFIL